LSRRHFTVTIDNYKRNKVLLVSSADRPCWCERNIVWNMERDQSFWITSSEYDPDSSPSCTVLYMILNLPRHCLIYDPESFPSLPYIWSWFFPVTVLYITKNNWNLSFIHYKFQFWDLHFQIYLPVNVINCYINSCNIMFVGIPWIWYFKMLA
jgi:hypothetical protein